MNADKKPKITSGERNNLVKAIYQLPKIQGMVLVLHYLQGRPLAEVANTLDLSASEITEEHHAALMSLRNSGRFDGTSKKHPGG